MKNGLYIYGMIHTSEPQEFGAIGVGNEATQVQTLVLRDVAAVVSRSPLAIYDSLAKEKIVKDLVTHQFVLEQVMQRFTVIPVKFGTMVETEDDVLSFLEKGHALLSNELDKNAAKIELDLVAHWELPKILPTLSLGNDQIQKKQRDIALAGDHVSIEEKIALGQLIEHALIAKKADYQQKILQTFNTITIDTCLHDLADEQMIFNGAFLLAKKDEESFYQRLNTLDQTLENTIQFRVVGPLPPYSFSTIILEKIDPKKVAEARETLALQGAVTEETIRDAYHRMARKYHPDAQSDEDAEDVTKFPRIHAAYQTLKHSVEHGLMRVDLYHWEKKSFS
jgi:hypothetical protein